MVHAFWAELNDLAEQSKTRQARLLYLVFTIRNGKVRIISARDINKKEVHLYEKAA